MQRKTTVVKRAAVTPGTRTHARVTLWRTCLRNILADRKRSIRYFREAVACNLRDDARMEVSVMRMQGGRFKYYQGKIRRAGGVIPPSLRTLPSVY